MNNSRSLLILSTILFCALSSPAQNPGNNCACCSGHYKDFDFWIGDWQVWEHGSIAGTNTVIKDQENCLVVENWRSEGIEFSGTSINFWDQENEVWRQIWLDNKGGRLELEGGMKDGEMVLESELDVNAKGQLEKNIITWTPLSNGEVRQHWTRTRDGGRNWINVFDGIYRPVPTN